MCRLRLAAIDRVVTRRKLKTVTAFIKAQLNEQASEASVHAVEVGPIVGLSTETTCYISLEYFAEKHPLTDYVVHEVAHIFHNCKRRTLGLPHSRSKE